MTAAIHSGTDARLAAPGAVDALGPPEGLSATLDATLAGVEAELAAVLARLDADWARLAGTSHDLLATADLPELVRQATAGGKRVRPTMVHWGWVAAGRDPAARDDVRRAGAAVELLHAFAILHDDVMDRSELRRGHTAAHARARDAHRGAGSRGDAAHFGNSIAVLAGDLVHAEACHLVADLPAAAREAWRTMMVELVMGQRLDLTGAAQGRQDLDHARTVAHLKTGSYTVEHPLRIGALLAGATPAALACLETYGTHVGVAFGLRDDVLGLWGDPARTGKPAGDDLVAGKATVLLALAADRLPPTGRTLLADAGTGRLGEAEAAQLLGLMERSGVPEAAEHLIAEEVVRALAALDPDHVTDDGIAGLTAVSRLAAWRDA